jgi:hypothetical protein
MSAGRPSTGLATGRAPNAATLWLPALKTAYSVPSTDITGTLFSGNVLRIVSNTAFRLLLQQVVVLFRGDAVGVTCKIR